MRSSTKRKLLGQRKPRREWGVHTVLSEGGDLIGRPVGSFGYREYALQTPVDSMYGYSPL